MQQCLHFATAPLASLQCATDPTYHDPIQHYSPQPPTLYQSPPTLRSTCSSGLLPM